MADGMDKLLYQAYLWQGGKLSYSAWLAAGKPQADGGKPPKDTGASATVTSPRPSPPTPQPPQVPKVNPVTGEITYGDAPSWLAKPPPTTPPVTTPPVTAPPVTTPEGLPGEVGLPPEAQGGYMVMIGNKWFYYGKNGIYYDLVDGQWLPVDTKTINTIAGSVTDPNALTPFQQWQIKLENWKWEESQRQAQAERDRQEAEARNKEWQAKYDIQREASQTAIQKQQNEMELIKGRAFPFPYEQGNRQAWGQMQSGAFESARQQILGSLSSPSDWIKRWEVQNAPNPYTTAPPSQLEEKQGQLTNTETRANMFDQMANESEKLVAQLETNPDYYGAGTPKQMLEPTQELEFWEDPVYGAGTPPYEAAVLTQARKDAVMYRNAAKAERDKIGVYQTDVTYLQGQPQPAISQPAARGNAPAPAWLPMFAPGQQAGRAITRENVATPSAQQWAGTPWSVQQGLSGYLDWAGYRPMADVLGNMAQMLPNAPGGGARWSPYIGR